MNRLHSSAFKLLQAGGLHPVPTGHSAHFTALVHLLLRAARGHGLLSGAGAENIALIAQLSVYHDIGKQCVPASILKKPGMLTNAEYQQVKRHAAEGCRLLDAVPGLSADPAYPLLYALCRHHHERWDGSGYPDGLRGDAIPGFVQVVGLADAYDALVSKRVYKKAYSHRQAVQMLCSGACGMFNPRLLGCFTACAAVIPDLAYGEVYGIA